ncbi:helix-turn-helix domain-containing protein [Paenibacillus sp. HB172176]|uniref:helix-turn-helix domain-containing protein n=1 Tax=Paenibacillus sp. HB172176 TaxID=2493690 RepID=UPI00143CA9CA|nr:helix-turn-helix domain-containing protein [Paenibacillus sp. HB172176]
MRKNKYFRKLLVIYMAIVLTYTFAVAGVFFYKNSEAVTHKLDENQKVFLLQMRDKIDMKFQVAFNLIRQFDMSEEVQAYSVEEDRDYYNITKVYDALGRNLTGFYDFGYRIDVTRPDDDLVIKPDSTTNKSLYYSRLGLSPEQVDQLNDYILDHTRMEPFILPRTEQFVGYLTMAQKRQIPGYGEVIYFISFQEAYLFPEQAVGGGDIGIVNAGELVAKQAGISRNRMDGAKTSDLLREVGDRPYEYDRLKLSNYMVDSVGSNQFGEIKYVHVLPRSTVKNQLAGILINALFIYGGLAIVGLAMAFLAARNMYKPIRNTVSVFHGLGGKESGDEFNFLRETALSIRQANESLQKTLLHHRLPLKNKFLLDWMFGLLSRGKVREGLERYGLLAFQKGMSVVVFEFLNDKEESGHFSREAILDIRKQTISIIAQQVKAEAACEWFAIDGSRYAMLVQEVATAKIKNGMSSSIYDIEAEYDIRLVAAIGLPAESAFEIETSYHAALQLLDGRFALSHQSILTLDEEGKEQNTSYFYPLDLERDLINYVIQGKEQQVNAILQRVLEQNLKERELNSDMLSQFMFALTATVQRIMQQLNKTTEEVLGQDASLHAELHKCESSQLLSERITDTFNSILSAVNVEKEQLDSKIADQMLAYIHNNYNRDLSLSDMAEQFNLSASYTSLLFGQYIGENFKDYLNEYRVRKAKEILTANADLKIYEIAGMVGCNHTNTFIRMFKKYAGVSPGAYAKNLERPTS